MRVTGNARALGPRTLATLAALAVLAASASLSCAVREETTPGGFVIAPSVPADAGVIVGDGGG